MRIHPTWLTVVALAVVVAACGDDDAATTEATEAPTTTAATTTTTEAPPTTSTTLPPIGEPFTTDSVLEIEGSTDIEGDGTAEIRITEDNKLLTSLNGRVPVVDGMTCPLCMRNQILGPGVRLELPLDGGESVFIVVGEEGATLEKVGAGYRLVAGESWLVTDPSALEG